MAPIHEEAKKEKRRFFRLDLASDVKYHVLKSDKELQQVSKHKISNVKNLSAGGLCFAIHEPVRKEDVIKLQFSLPDGKRPVVTFADVVWIQVKGGETIVGVRFMAIKDEDVSRINVFIDSARNSIKVKKDV